jgi:hypothetical protein
MTTIQTIRTLLVFVLFMAFGFGLTRQYDLLSDQHTLFVFLVGLSLGFFCHELGHVLGAVLAGIPVGRCVMGAGGPFRWRWGRTWFQLNPLPIYGHVYYGPILRVDRKSEQMLLLVGGMVGNLFAIGAVVAAIRFRLLAPRDAATIIQAQAVLIAFTFFPGSGIEGLRTGSDAVQILMMIFRRDRRPTAAGRVYLDVLRQYEPNADESLLDGAGAVTVAKWYLQRESQIRRRYWGQLKSDLQQLLDTGGMAPATELALLDLLLSQALVLADVASADELQNWSARGIELAPRNKTTVENRAAALIRLGHYEAGRDTLYQLYQFERSLTNILNRIYVAEAELGLGNDEVAMKHLRTARLLADFRTPELVLAMIKRVAVAIAERRQRQAA